jgi:hypothetical protein
MLDAAPNSVTRLYGVLRVAGQTTTETRLKRPARNQENSGGYSHSSNANVFGTRTSMLVESGAALKDNCS